MKKTKKLIAAALCISSLFSVAANAYEATELTETTPQTITAETRPVVFYNGMRTSLYTYIEDGKILVPVEETAKAMNLAMVEYYADSKCYLISDYSHLLAIYMDNPYTIIDEFGYNTALAPRFIDGVAYMYLDVLTQSFGATYSFDGTNISIIDYSDKIGELKINDKSISLNNPVVVKNGKLLLPIKEFANLLKLSCTYHRDYDCYMLSNAKGTPLAIYINNPYTVVNNFAYNSPVTPLLIDGIAYAYADVITQAFEISLTEYDKNISIKYVIETPKPQIETSGTSEETFINSSGKSSATDYLVWVSKKDFRVHVFLGKQGEWDLIRSMKCSIGAPKTPTCEGTYKFYEQIKKWDYGSYYVGPVLRFNGGYALHSTLVNNNGTLRDGRLEKQISHGCIRIAPEDMNWVFSYVPLSTTIYITP